MKGMGLQSICVKFAVMNGGENLVKITISGHPGSGTSTLVNGICDHFNWSSLNGGQIFRDEAKRRGLSLSDFGDLCASDFSVDKSLDDVLQEKIRDPNGPDVVESRLSGWWAYKLEIDCVRLWVDVNDEVRAQRVVDREGITLEKAIFENKKRSQKDRSRYIELYGLIPEDKEPYTHIIDASQKNISEVLQETVKILEASE